MYAKCVRREREREREIERERERERRHISYEADIEKSFGISPSSPILEIFITFALKMRKVMF